jgi:hypothetical protein
MSIAPIVAHAGEEVILIVAGAWIVYLLIKGMRGERSDAPEAGPCLYCGTFLPKEVARCPTCGFPARRAGSDSPLAAPAASQERSAR